MNKKMDAAGPAESPHKGKTGLKRVRSAFFYSMAGLRAALRHEDAFRQEVFLAVLLIPAAFFTPATGTGKALLIAAVFGIASESCVVFLLVASLLIGGALHDGSIRK